MGLSSTLYHLNQFCSVRKCATSQHCAASFPGTGYLPTRSASNNILKRRQVSMYTATLSEEGSRMRQVSYEAILPHLLRPFISSPPIHMVMLEPGSGEESVTKSQSDTNHLSVQAYIQDVEQNLRNLLTRHNDVSCLYA